MYYKCYYDSPLGKMLLISTTTKLVGVWFEGQKYYPLVLENISLFKEDLTILLRTKDWLCRYFALDKPDPYELDFFFSGTTFQKMVWEELLKIPYGEMTTYGEIAKNICTKTGKDRPPFRAVGNAIGHNPISIIVPCHRVAGKNGELTGYAGGIDRKKKLLEIENIFLP